jgi:RNA polymerase sigma-70 factor (ECF subfamily)
MTSALRARGGASPAAAADSRQLEQWIADARAGSSEALNRLLETCRDYLLRVANDELDSRLQGKVGASDIVQESLIQAQRDMPVFRGTTEPELLAWLRGILLNDLNDVRRRFFHSAKRDVDREVRLAGDSRQAHPAIDPVASGATPAAAAIAHEETEALRLAIARLPGDYRNVIDLRNWQLLSFAEIGHRLNRSEDAARKLWARAIERLEQELESPDETR